MDKKYDNKLASAQMRELWNNLKVYTAQPGKPVYSIDTPPPTVSGSLHIGHIFSYTQTDIIARFKRMSGYSVFYPFGFDDNGLPTERFVEKKRNIVAHSLSRSAFIDICLEETVAVEKQFQELWEAIGLSVDWDQCYSTIGTLARTISQASFLELYKKGYVYRKDEPALYCTACRTSVAQAELDDTEKPSFFNDVQFSTVDGKPLVIGTTRPELLPSCVALLYNPADTRYQHLQGAKARVPLYNFEVPIIADESVLIDKGTGLVMCCTFGDKTDIAWFKKYNLPYHPSVSRDGRWAEHTGALAGLKAKQAREKVLELLKEAELLLNQKPISHAVNVHERCKQEIEFLMIQQWFLSLLPYKQTFIELADKIEWYPHFMKSRYINWVENISWDWCLSRQRFFGIPFPAWHCQDCNQVIVPDAKELPVDPQEQPYKGKCPACNSSALVPDTDVMDTWNTSSLTPYLCAALAQGSTDNIFATDRIPMGMRPQAHDIIRTWAFDTIVKVWMHQETIPWKTIVISGHVLSTEKEKISKSQGNSPLQPENLLKNYSADAIRYWTASGSLGHDIAFSESQLKIGEKLVNKLWNAFLFVSTHIASSDMAPLTLSLSKGLKDTTSIPGPSPINPLNQWIIHQATVAYAQYQKAFTEHEFSHGLLAIERLFWQDFCDNYVELVKDQFFKPENYTEAELQDTRNTLYAVGLRILQMYAPYIPYITEAIYQQVYKAGSLHATQFADAQALMHNEEARAIGEQVLAVVAQVRKIKSEKALSLKTPIQQVTIICTPVVAAQLKQCEREIKGIMHIQDINYARTGEVRTEHKDEQWFITIELV